MARGVKVIGAAIFAALLPLTVVSADGFIRINQAGYLQRDKKAAVVISKTPLSGGFSVFEMSRNNRVFRGEIHEITAGGWGGMFIHYYEIDFSRLERTGNYRIRLDSGSIESPIFPIGWYPHYQEELLSFMRQQRCGYNPFFGVYCHQKDAKSFYGPVADGTLIDVTGGWHDAGDQLKYLITASNATARMLFAYELEKRKFADKVDAAGVEEPNGIPDILDEAKWGLDWIFKLHPAPDQLYHQVADDRDHRGFKIPDRDNSDYGWGQNSFRPVYFADGKPQGLSKWKSKATGIANIAGRSSAAMALAYRIWKDDLRDNAFAERCLKAAVELYRMGQRQEGFQQGNSFGAPYRYNEDTWADDMEWAAAELYKALGQDSYLEDSKRYAHIAGTTSWMQFDTSEMGQQMSRHYEMYPFTNIGHFALWQVADRRTKKEVVGYYRQGIESVVSRSKSNPYGIGVPFLWCSNNLVVAFITQTLLYERMTGDRQYRATASAHRDWLFGRNPWGTSMFTMIPRFGEFPEDVHLPSVQLLKRQVPGGLVDGPIDAGTYSGLLGLQLHRPDEFLEFQTDRVVYHDDVGDYATNEPTMDGTADAILVMAALSTPSGVMSAARSYPRPDTKFTYDQGAIVRGPKTQKRLAIVFTGDEFGDGLETIKNALNENRVKASFFFTGRFYRNPRFSSAIRELVQGGHYLGAHSDSHLLYADWQDRSKTLVSREEFIADLNNNYFEMERFGISRNKARYFLPPFEWYNAEIAEWARSTGLELINFTSGTRANADYTTPDMGSYVSSAKIFESIRHYESAAPNGLNGFILLLHVGTHSSRTDKFYDKLDELLRWLEARGYRPVKISELLI